MNDIKCNMKVVVVSLYYRDANKIEMDMWY
jgi:hypothetical protein